MMRCDCSLPGPRVVGVWSLPAVGGHLPTRWTATEQRTVLCAYRRALEHNPDVTRKALLILAQSALPLDRRLPYSTRVMRWLADAVEHPMAAAVQSEADPLRPLLKMLSPASLCILQERGTDIVSAVVSGVIANKNVGAALGEAIRLAVARHGARTQPQMHDRTRQAVLAVGVSRRHQLVLRDRFAAAVSLVFWSDSQALSLLQENILATNRVIVCGKVSGRAEHLLTSVEYERVIRVEDPDQVQVALRALVSWKSGETSASVGFPVKAARTGANDRAH